jgi:serine/threonine protein kinase
MQTQTEKEEELELIMDNQQLQLLGQGTYGCAFYPEISCKTHHVVKGSSSTQYLSKIQIKDKSLQRELDIGQRIVKRIPNYRYFVAPIIESCPVQLSSLRQNKIKQCNVLTKASLSNRTIVSSKVPYLGKLTLEKYFHTLFHQQHCINNKNQTSKCVSMSVTYLKKLINTYLYLIQSYQKLNVDVGVVHLDVKADNIMYDAKHHLPIIIDLGMSYCVEWLQMPAYLSFKYPFGIQTMSYSPWCIEVSLLTHLAHYLRRGTTPNRHGGYLDEALLKSPTPPELIATYQNFCVDYVKNNITIREVFTDAERQTYQTELQRWVASLQSKTIESLWTSLLSTYRDWDQYALALTYLCEMHDSDLLHLFPKPESGVVVATPVWAFVHLLKRVILSIPGQRPSSQQLFQEARALFAKMTLTNYQRVSSVKLPPARAVAKKNAQRAVQQQQPPM